MSQFTYEQILQANQPQHENVRKEIVSFFQENGYILVTDIPDLNDIQAQLYQEVEKMNQQFSYKEMIYSNLGMEKSNESFIYANNIFPLQNEELVKKALKIKDQDSPEILQRIDVNQDLAKSELDFANISRKLFIVLLKLIFTNQDGLPQLHSEPKQEGFKLLKIVTQSLEKSEIQKYKCIYDFSQDSNEAKRFISTDFGFGSLISLSTLDITKQENQQSNCFIIQKNDQEKSVITLKSTDAILTCGDFLSELSSGVIKKPKYFIQTKNSKYDQNLQINQQFFYPNLNFGDLLQLNKSTAINQQALGLYSFYSKALTNDWIYKHHQKIIDFQANEYVQLLFKEELYPEICFQKKNFLNQENQIDCFHFNLIDSTMNIAKFWKKIYVSDKMSYAFLADQQFKGQGQNKNVWISPKGNCYVTFLVKFNPLLSYCLQQLSAVSVIETLDQYVPASQKEQLSPVLKWVNDIFVNEKKISGALCKLEDEFLSIGIGVNLNHKPTEVVGSTCLKDELNQQNNIDVFDFVQKLWTNLSKNLQIVLEQSSYQIILDKVQQRMLYLNQKVKIYDATLTNVIQEGIFKGLNEYGNALLSNLNDSEQIEAIYDGRMRQF